MIILAHIYYKNYLTKIKTIIDFSILLNALKISNSLASINQFNQY